MQNDRFFCVTKRRHINVYRYIKVSHAHCDGHKEASSSQTLPPIYQIKRPYISEN